MRTAAAHWRPLLGGGVKRRVEPTSGFIRIIFPQRKTFEFLLSRTLRIARLRLFALNGFCKTVTPFPTIEVKDADSAVYPVAKTTPRLGRIADISEYASGPLSPGITTSRMTRSIWSELVLKSSTASVPFDARTTR